MAKKAGRKKIGKGKLPVSVIVLTKDEEANLPGCLNSLSFADQVVVVDSKSTDRTVAVARKAGADVHVRPWPGYAQQRNFALSKCRHEWVLSVDADERVSPGLRREVKRVVSDPQAAQGYMVPEVNLYFGRWLRYGGIYPSGHMVLFKRKGLKYRAKAGVHEGVGLENPGWVDGHLIHHAYPSMELALDKLNQYTRLEAEGRWKQGQRAGLYGLLWRPLRKFIKKYVFQLGFLDGAQGLLYCCLSTYYTFIFHAKLWEKDRRRNAAGIK